MVLNLKMVAVLAFLLVDDSRFCAANASNDVEYKFLRKKITSSMLQDKPLQGPYAFLNSSLSLCNTIGGCERTLSISEQNSQP